MRAVGGKAPKALYTDLFLIDIMTEVIGKKCTDKKTGLGNREPLEALNDTQVGIFHNLPNFLTKSVLVSVFCASIQEWFVMKNGL